MINQLEFRHLNYFLVLADTLHYREASEKLYITQSALSQQIQRLELILGKKLFIRTNRKVRLSPEGIAFQREATLLQNQATLSMERWQAAISGKQGILRIGFVGSAMQAYLPSILKKFSAVPKNHKISDANFKDISQLANESFILFPNAHSQMYYEQIISLCKDHGFVPKISHRSIHAPTVFKLVESGLGISIVPNSLRDEHNYQIDFIELNKIPQKTELFAVWNKTNTNIALPYFLKVL